MRTLVKKHLDALKNRRGCRNVPTLVGFWGANHTLHSGALSQWYMHRTECIEVSPRTIPTLHAYWHGDLDGYYLVPSAEHAMMLAKAIVFDNPTKRNNMSLIQLIRVAPAPADAKAYGRKVTGFVGSIWDTVKYSIVLEISYEKFSKGHCLDIAKHYINESHKDPNGLLFVETSPYDNIWGIKSGKLDSIDKWKGDNLLGFAITEAFDLIESGEKPW